MRSTWHLLLKCNEISLYNNSTPLPFFFPLFVFADRVHLHPKTFLSLGVCFYKSHVIAWLFSLFHYDKLFHTFLYIWQQLNVFFRLSQSTHHSFELFSNLDSFFFGIFYSLYIFNCGIILLFCYWNNIIFKIFVFTKEVSEESFLHFTHQYAYILDAELIYFKTFTTQIHDNRQKRNWKQN